MTDLEFTIECAKRLMIAREAHFKADAKCLEIEAQRETLRRELKMLEANIALAGWIEKQEDKLSSANGSTDPTPEVEPKP